MAQLKSQNNRIRKTLYWGVDISKDNILPLLEQHNITDYIEQNNLKLKDEFHATLLFLNKNNLHQEEKYKELEGLDCILEINKIGKTPNAIAFQIENMTYTKNDNNIQLPSDQESINHITIALANGTKAKDSVKSLHNETNITDLNEKFIIKGKVKRYTN